MLSDAYKTLFNFTNKKKQNKKKKHVISKIPAQSKL